MNVFILSCMLLLYIFVVLVSQIQFSIIKLYKYKISSTGIFIAITNNSLTIQVKIIDFSFMPKILRILSKDNVP